MSDAQRTPGAGFIFGVLFLDILGIGLIVPILPALVTDMVGGDPSIGARYYGPLVAVFALMQFLFAPILGALSDRFGRRPVLLTALAGYGLDYLILGFAPTLAWLVLGRVLGGILGATITTANAYLADISTPETRARNFGLVGAAFGLGFVFGPALGGVLGEVHQRLPFFVAAGLVGLNWLYGYFVLPESLPPEKRRVTPWREINPLSVLLRLRRYPVVLSLSVAYAFFFLAQRGLESVWVLYATERYGWSELENGLSLAVVGVAAAFNQGWLIRKVVPRFGEYTVVVQGFLLSALAFVGYGLCGQGWMIFFVIPLGSLGGMAYPTLQGIVTGHVAPDEQGAVQGALAALGSLTAVAAPILSTSLFSRFTTDEGPGAALPYLPGAPFFVGGALLLGAAAVAARALRRAGLSPSPSPHRR